MIAPLDRSSSPTRIASNGEDSPYFGPSGEIQFRFSDGKFNYIGRMNMDGSSRRKVVEYAIATIQTFSPDRRWVVGIVPWSDGDKGTVVMAIPTEGGPPRHICGVCSVAWSPDGKLLYVIERPSMTTAGAMIVMPVVPETGLPDLPRNGVQERSTIGGRWVAEHGAVKMVPGIDRETYAYVKTTVHRSLFRIPRP